MLVLGCSAEVDELDSLCLEATILSFIPRF